MRLTRVAALPTAGFVAAMAISGAANAATYTCPDYFEAGTFGVDGKQNGSLDSPGYACNLGTNDNTPESIETTLAASLGAGWSRIDKSDSTAIFDPSWPNPLTLTPPEGANSGAWRLASGIWGVYDRLVLVLKDGNFDPNGKDALPDPIKWVWYEIKAGDYSGDWFLGNVINCRGDKGVGKKDKPGAQSTGSTDPVENCRKNLSHGELFGFGDGPNDVPGDPPSDDPPNDVPEPGSLALLGLGLLGLGASKLRRRA